MSDLIARLREAKGADKELGELVLLACDWHKTSVGNFYGPLYHWYGPKGEHFKDDDFAAHNPTASIDAALLAVPDDWTRSVDATAPELLIDVELYAPGEDGKVVRGTHASEPIATCIAALLARGIE